MSLGVGEAAEADLLGAEQPGQSEGHTRRPEAGVQGPLWLEWRGRA